MSTCISLHRPRHVEASHSTAILASTVSSAARAAAMASHFGTSSTVVETEFLGWMQRLCASQPLGPWRLVELSNGGAYLAPESSDRFDLCLEGRGFESQVSPDVAGVIATVFALNTLTWRGWRSLTGKYGKLIAYVGNHPDRTRILGAVADEIAQHD